MFGVLFVALARAAEERGIESLFAPEHSHIPVSRLSPWGGGAELPKMYGFQVCEVIKRNESLRDIHVVLAGAILLVLFAIALTRIDSVFAGRTFAAYGGVYIFSSLVWLWAVEGARPDRWDIIGGLVCIAGALIIIAVPRTAVA